MAEEYDYPEDEFDRLAEEREVFGAHRELKTTWGWKIATIAIIVIVPVVAWLFVRIGAVDSVADKIVTPSAVATDGQGDNQEMSGEEGTSADGSEDSSEGESQQASEEADMSVEVRVLNGSGVNGLAAKKEEMLKSAGFTNTVADNYKGGSSPSQSTVYYAKEEDAATAKKVGSTLGISEVKLSPESVSGGKGIVAVLRSDAA